MKYTPLAFGLELFCAVLILGLMALTALLYPDVTGAVPKSYDLYGTVTAWGDRSAALLTPLIAVYIYLISTGVGIMARRFPGADKPGSALPTVLLMILIAKAVYLAYGFIRTYHVMHAQEMPAFVFLILPVGIGLTVVLGVVIIQKQRAVYRDVKHAQSLIGM